MTRSWGLSLRFMVFSFAHFKALWRRQVAFFLGKSVFVGGNSLFGNSLFGVLRGRIELVIGRFKSLAIVLDNGAGVRSAFQNHTDLRGVGVQRCPPPRFPGRKGPAPNRVLKVRKRMGKLLSDFSEAVKTARAGEFANLLLHRGINPQLRGKSETAKPIFA